MLLYNGVQTIKKSTEALVVASKEIDLNINADKTSYITTPLMKTLRADCSQGVLFIIRCRTFCFPICNPKI
jgi:hypothetical protein